MSNIYKHTPFGNKNFESSARIDQAFFETHPDAKKYYRKVARNEVPLSLRKMRVHAVEVYRVSVDGILLRAFVDVRGRIAGKSLYIDDKIFSTAAGRRDAQFCQKLFAALVSLEQTRGE